MFGVNLTQTASNHVKCFVLPAKSVSTLTQFTLVELRPTPAGRSRESRWGVADTGTSEEFTMRNAMCYRLAAARKET